jgi:flagellin
VTGAATAATGTTFAPTGVTVQISGAGLAGPVNLTFATADNTVNSAISDLQTQVQNSTALKAAGITVTGAAGSPLVFTSATGETLNVQSTGDTQNVLGLGALDTSASVSSPAFYSTITGAAPSTGNGLTTLGFSLNGGATGGGTAATIAGTAPSGITAGATVNTSALTTLALNVNGTAVSVNMANDANNGATETLANVVKYINSQVDAKMGWGNSVSVAAITPLTSGAASTITLTSPTANLDSSLAVTTSATATALGLTGTNTGTGALGNTIALNLAGGDATSAAYTSGSVAAANVNTSVANAALNFSIDGQAVVANFANDANSAGTAAALVGGALGAAATVNTAKLETTAAIYSGGAIGANANTGALQAQAAVYTGAGVAGDSFAAIGAGGGITINGQAVNDADSPTTLEGVMNDINNNTPALSGVVTASIVTNNGIESLKLTSVATGGAASIDVVDSADAEAAGLTVSGQSGDSIATGTAAKTLSITVPGANSGNPQLINFSTDAHAGATESEANIISFINANLTGALASFTASGALTITSTATGSAAAVGVNNTSAAQALGLTTAGSANPTTVNGKDETLAQVVSFLNTTAQQALGTSTANAIFSVNGGGNLAIASQTKGVASNISLAAGTGNTASTASIETALGLGNVNGTLGTTGTNASLTSIVNTLNQAFTANTTLQEAGLQASATNGGTTLSVTSSNNTNFRLDEYGTTGTNLGFGNTSGPFTGLTSGVSNASIIDAGGTSAIGNGSIASPYLSFSALQFGSDAQAVTISANSSAGVLQSLTLTLRNDSNPSATESGPQSGATIDSAVSYINAQLQQSNNPTLKGIVAVKENVSGTEQINFLSALPSFSVSVGGSVNGNGLNGGTAQTFGSVANGAATNASIDTVAGALSAVTAVTNAVANLGTAQAAVGIGENQVNYAVNLAQSQITNISAAESQIRDANVAAEAANLTKAQVLVQATVAAMAQANQEPQAILKLLQQ